MRYFNYLQVERQMSITTASRRILQTQLIRGRVEARNFPVDDTGEMVLVSAICGSSFSKDEVPWSHVVVAEHGFAWPLFNLGVGDED